MKHLQEFIIENIINIFENTLDNIKYLIADFDSSENETLMSGKEFYDSSNKLQNCLSEDNLKRIFNYGKEHFEKKDIKEIMKRPEPLVANYGNKAGDFAFRRWVKDAVKELGITLIGNENKLYHDTNLKGNGEWVPTAQDMEDIIAMGYNNINELKLAQEQKNKKIEQIIKYYQDHKEVIDEIAQKIDNKTKTSSPLKKLETKNITASDEWKILGTYKDISKINKTPKTDIISEDNILRISLKEEGGSQLMSGAYHEAKATILTAIKKAECENDAKELIEILKAEWLKGFKSIEGIDNIKKNKTHKDYEIISKADENGKKVQDLLNKLIDSNKKFEYELLYEAMTGEIKFGEKNPASANYILVWNDNKPELSHFYNPKEYIEHLKKSKIQYLINFKSANNSSWQNLRIVCGNASKNDSEKINISPIK